MDGSLKKIMGWYPTDSKFIFVKVNESGELILALPADCVSKNEFDAKGDLIVGKEDNDFVVLSVGTDGKILEADSGEISGLKWAAKPSATVNPDKLNLVIAMGGTPDEQIDVDADCLMLHTIAFVGKGFTSINLTIDNTVGEANGIDTGLVTANTWYSVWVIGKADGTKAGLFHAGGTGIISDLTLPTDYIYARCVGWVLTDASSDFLPGYWKGNWFYWDVRRTILDDATADTNYTDIDCSSFIPPVSSRIMLNINYDDSNNYGNLYIRRKSSAETNIICNSARDYYLDWIQNTDNSQVIEYKGNFAGAIKIHTFGYIYKI